MIRTGCRAATNLKAKISEKIEDSGTDPRDVLAILHGVLQIVGNLHDCANIQCLAFHEFIESSPQHGGTPDLSI